MSTTIVQQENAAALPPGTVEAGEKDIALVYMPWGSVSKPSIALGILKQCAKNAGFTADVLYLNLKFAGMVGFEMYEHINGRSAIYPEWFFSALLFGHDTQMMRNSWHDLPASNDGQHMARQLCKLTNGDEEQCVQIISKTEQFMDECISQINWKRYKAVGFSVTFAQSMASLCLARRIKEKFPEIAIIMGGANVDAEMGFEILKAFDWVDYIVHGEAEETFPELMRAITEERLPIGLAGVSYRQGSEKVAGFDTARPMNNMNASPTPDYSDFFQETAKSAVDRVVRISLPIESSRGCWWGAKHHCTFCGLNGQTMNYRKKTSDRVYDEIMSLAQQHRCLSFNAVDNILDMSYFRDLLPSLASANIDLSVFYEVKANLNRQQVKLLAEAGVKRIQPGIESFSTELLRLMRKGVTAIQNIQFLKWCREFGVDPMWNILYGFPGENPEHYDDYPRILRLLFHLKPPSGLFPVIFERFSPYHFDRGRFKLQIRPMPHYKLLYPEDKVDLEKIAYFFEGTWENQKQDPNDYIEPTREVFSEWTDHWRDPRTIFFCYDKGPGFLTLYDNRPLQPGVTELKIRRNVLNEFQSRVYLFCEESRSLRSVCDMLAKEYTTAPSEEKVQRLLDGFVENKFMFREGDRYLALAIRKRQERETATDQY
jgi:ribosomal peptide maturation radical SAM protein 1